jgi:ubiquitin-conjugating enzyme E2 A
MDLSSSTGSEARKRLVKDFKKMQTESPQGFTASPTSEDNLFQWEALLFGPEDTPWEGGTFKLSLSFTDQYPKVAPKVVFLSKIFHPNVYGDGRICLDILDNNWSPVYDVYTTLLSLQSLLSDPNPRSPANAEAARLYETDKAVYNQRITECVEKT